MGSTLLAASRARGVGGSSSGRLGQIYGVTYSPGITFTCTGNGLTFSAWSVRWVTSSSFQESCVVARTIRLARKASATRSSFCVCGPRLIFLNKPFDFASTSTTFLFTLEHVRGGALRALKVLT
jgi:hypothetical protein